MHMDNIRAAFQSARLPMSPRYLHLETCGPLSETVDSKVHCAFPECRL